MSNDITPIFIRLSKAAAMTSEALTQFVTTYINYQKEVKNHETTKDQNTDQA